MYPSIMIRYGYFSRNIPEEGKILYSNILEWRKEAKKQGDKNTANGYKLIANSLSGLFGDKTSAAYDPRMRISICVAGQLLLLDLVEHIERNCPEVKFIQLNTDGVFLSTNNTDDCFDRIDTTVAEWEKRTGLGMEFTTFKKMFQINVNNYLAIDLDDKLVRKGAAFKKCKFDDGQLPIIRDAVINKLVYGIPIHETIMNCNDLMQFQNVIVLSGKYKYATTKVKYVGGQTLGDESGRLPYKTMRVFASLDPEDGALYKVSARNDTAARWPNTPYRLFVTNDDVKGKPVPAKLDREFYINLARERFRAIYDDRELF